MSCNFISNQFISINVRTTDYEVNAFQFMFFCSGLRISCEIQLGISHTFLKKITIFEDNFPLNSIQWRKLLEKNLSEGISLFFFIDACDRLAFLSNFGLLLFEIFHHTEQFIDSIRFDSIRVNEGANCDISITNNAAGVPLKFPK